MESLKLYSRLYIKACNLFIKLALSFLALYISLYSTQEFLLHRQTQLMWYVNNSIEPVLLALNFILFSSILFIGLYLIHKLLAPLFFILSAIAFSLNPIYHFINWYDYIELYQFWINIFIHLNIVAIIWYFVFKWIIKKEYYEYLNVFGSVIFIIWLSIFSAILTIRLATHYQWVQLGVNIFNFAVIELPGNFKLLPYLILFSIAVIIILLLYINISRISKIIITYIKEKIRTSYQDEIIALIYEDAAVPLTQDDLLFLKKVKRFRFTRTIFTEELLRMHEILFGIINDRINIVLNGIGVVEDAFYYLHHNKWHYKIKGLRIYAQLGDKTELPYINKLIESPNHVLRIEAQIAIARLSEDENPLDFLKNLKHTLTLWEQINLIHYFIHYKKNVGNISSLLESKNASVNFFGLRCAGIFNQFEHYDLIIELTKHEDKQIQECAYDALSLFQKPESSEYIISKYHAKLPVSTQIAMIKAIGQIGNMSAIPFLKDQLLFEVEYQVCMELFKAILKINPDEAHKTATMGDLELMKIFDHVNDSRI